MASSPNPRFKSTSAQATIRVRHHGLRPVIATQVMACLALIAGCTGEIRDPATGDGSGGAKTSGTGGTGQGSGTGGVGQGSGSGGAVATGTGGTGPTGSGGTASGSGGAATGGSAGGSGGGIPTASGGSTVALCPTVTPPTRAPLRRLTRFEYNNTVNTLLGDATSPGNSLPTSLIGNGFGNDADLQSVPPLLVEQYGVVAGGIASRATATATALGKLSTCAGTITATSTTATEEACAKTFIAAFLPRAYRRPVTTVETDDIFALYRTVRTGRTFASAIAGVLEGVLQAPDFLYRLEFGAPDKNVPSLKRPTGPEMATRLSYLFWGTSPDDALAASAASGELLTNAGVMTQATRLLNDQTKTRQVLRFFFSNLLPINGLTDVSRDAKLFPTFSPAIGQAMSEETLQFLENEIYSGGGTWPSALTAPYTYVNAALATYYGISGVTGTAFQKVMLPDPTKRLGLLTQGGVMTGTIVTNTSNPVLRGSFILNKIMCMNIPLPTDPVVKAMVVIPADTSGPTARDRFSKHSAQALCSGCHNLLDPVGFALENYDQVGLYRTQENGVNIDASGSVPGTTGTINGPVELVQKIASAPATQKCFATHWMDFGYGRTMGAEEPCSQAAVQDAFQKSGYNVKQLLLALTQSEEFLYLPK